MSFIQSLSGAFGSGVVVEDFGLLLQNRGALFLLDPDSPDVLAPRKRPFHTIIPAFMQKGDLHVGFGIMGGLNQPQAHAQFVSNLVDYGMNIQGALEAPRFTKLNFGGCDFMIEDRVPEVVRQALIGSRPSSLHCTGLIQPRWAGTGGDARFRHWRELRRIIPAQRRSRRSAARSLLLESFPQIA